MSIVSFMPESWISGGGLWDNKDVRFGNTRFISDWDYKGKANPSPVLASDLIDVVTGEEIETQVWSIGSGFTASQDGKKSSQTGDLLLGGALIKSSNILVLFESILDAIPDDKKEEYIEKLFGSGKASAFDGLEAHMIRKKIVREGLVKKVRPDGKVFDTTTPVVDTIIKYPWEKSKKAPPGAVAGAKAATVAKSVTAKAAVPTGDLSQKAFMLIGQVLGENPNGMSRDDLNGAVFALGKVAKERNEISKLVYNPEWLTANGEAGGFVYDEEGDTVTAAE